MTVPTRHRLTSDASDRGRLAGDAGGDRAGGAPHQRAVPGRSTDDARRGGQGLRGATGRAGCRAGGERSDARRARLDDRPAAPPGRGGRGATPTSYRGRASAGGKPRKRRRRRRRPQGHRKLPTGDKEEVPRVGASAALVGGAGVAAATPGGGKMLPPSGSAGGPYASAAVMGKGEGTKKSGVPRRAGVRRAGEHKKVGGSSR